MTDARELQPMHGVLRVADWHSGDLRGRVRVGGVEYAVYATRRGSEWQLELTLQTAETAEATEGLSRVL